MTVSVVIPTTRNSVRDLINSLNRGLVRPDEIVVVTNEDIVFDVPNQRDRMDAPLWRVGFDSTIQPYGVGDAGLRRNIGADVAESDILLFLDDDVIAPYDLIASTLPFVKEDGFCWGHHRFIDFDEYPIANLLDLPPERGRSREAFVNDWHGWQSSYAGNFAIKRDLFWEVGGFDLAYLGHHGSEDQQLGRRLSKGTNRTFVHEPPFAWHPTVPGFHSQPRTNIMGAHQMVRTTVNGHEFVSCVQCPCREPIDVPSLTMSEQVVIRYSREQFTLKKERI